MHISQEHTTTHTHSCTTKSQMHSQMHIGGQLREHSLTHVGGQLTPISIQPQRTCKLSMSYAFARGYSYKFIQLSAHSHTYIDSVNQCLETLSSHIYSHIYIQHVYRMKVTYSLSNQVQLATCHTELTVIDFNTVFDAVCICSLEPDVLGGN